MNQVTNPSKDQKSKDQSSADQKHSGVKKTVVLLVVAMAVIFGLFLNRFYTPALLSDKQLYTLGARVFEPPRRFEQPELLDQNGQVFDYASLQNKWSLVFFGFTFCPDICPATLAQIRTALSELEPDKADTTQVILVSVDPARDTPAKLKEYLAYFSKDYVGITGEFLKLQKFASQLNAAFQKVPGGGENYSVDHSGQIMLINPKGDYHGFLKPPFTPKKIREGYLGVRTNFEIRYGDQ